MFPSPPTLDSEINVMALSLGVAGKSQNSEGTECEFSFPLWASHGHPIDWCENRTPDFGQIQQDSPYVLNKAVVTSFLKDEELFSLLRVMFSIKSLGHTSHFSPILQVSAVQVSPGQRAEFISKESQLMVSAALRGLITDPKKSRFIYEAHPLSF